ncbi:hypothetical protein M8J76_002893 [Diaphorina citri]|nr:hypothetical protein M8J76_002893 [Diaphorina citri]
MGDFHRTYSKVWWPNLNLEDSLSPSSSPSSSNGSHRSQDSGFSDSSTSKQNAEHLRNFAHTPENQIHSSPEPCENIAEEVEGNEDIILPESQYSDTPIRARKPVKSNTQEKDKKAYTSVHNNSTVLDNGVTSHLLHHDVTKSRQNQPLSGKSVQTPPYSEPPKYKPTGLIESEKLNYLRKKDNRKSLGLIRNPDKKSSIENTKKNRHSMSLNLVSHQNEENVNPRLYQSYSEQQQLYQRQNPTLPQTRSNEIFRETYNFQPYRTDKNQNQNSKTSRVIEMRTPVGSNKKASTMSNQNVCTIENLPHATSSQELYATSVYSNTNVIPEVQNTQKDTAIEISSDMKSVLSENRIQSTSERNSVILQNLKPAQRQLLENLTANYFSKSNPLDKDESIYENLEKNLDSKVIYDKVQKCVSTNLQQMGENRNSVSLNITSTAFNETISPLNHSVDNHNYSATEIFEPRNNLQRYHTYSQICDQDSNCFIKKWENSMADSSASQSNILDNSSIHDSCYPRYNMSQCSNQLTQDSSYSGYSSNLTEASYYLPGYSSSLSATQKNHTNHIGTTRNSSTHVNDSRTSNTDGGRENISLNSKATNCTSSQRSNSNNIGLLQIAHQSSMDTSMLSESINSVLSRHRSKSNEILDKSQSLKSPNLSLNESCTQIQDDQRTVVQNKSQNHPIELSEQGKQNTGETINEIHQQPSSSSHLNANDFLKFKLRRRSGNESNVERSKRSRSLARVNRHSTSFENYQQEQLNLIRRCKSLNNLESNQEVPCKVESVEDPVLRGGKSFLQSNLDLIEPPHFTSTPKKLPRPLEIYRRRSPAPRVTIANNEEEHKTTRSTDPPVSHWLRELSQRYDAEYMTALQSKALISERLGENQILSGPVSQYILTLQEKIRTISSEFTKLLRQIEKIKWELIGPLSQSLLGHIEQFLSDYRVSSPLMRSECEALRSEAFREPPSGEKLKTRISSLGKSFATIVDQILFDQIKVLLSTLEKDRTPATVLSTLSSLTKLGLDSAHLGNLVARYPGGGMRTILSVCLDVPCLHVTICALRTITLLCSSVQCIRQLEKCNGIEILADILADESRDETVLSEAISVLAQVTAPWLDTNQSVADLHRHVDTFVAALTRLMRKQLNSETLLLISAALANLSFMEPKAVWSMTQHNSIGILLTAVRKLATRASVFLQEQTATLIANMAAVPEARPSLAQARAVVALLCFLQTRASPLQRAPEIMAAERLQHKSAIALSRLCSDVEIAQQVVELQGVNRLVKLCKEERERNHSDGVLVACLAALRKITTNCGTDIVEELNAIELVEPNLLDSFMLYSSKQESYV